MVSHALLICTNKNERAAYYHLPARTFERETDASDKMSVRNCLYKKCQNFITTGDKTSRSKPNLTLFAFPKDVERRKKWLELGKAPANLPINYYFYCSDHFDKCFLNVGHRRTTLVGEAIPHAYQSDNEDDEDLEYSGKVEYVNYDDDWYLKDEDNNFDQGGEERQQHTMVESTTTTTTINYDDDMQLIVKELGLSKDNHTTSGQSSGSANVENKTYKRKIRNLEATTSVPSSKIKFLQHTETLTTLPPPAENNIRIVSSSSIPSYTVLDSDGYISLDLNEDNKPSTCKNITKAVEANEDREESTVELNPEKLIDAENVSSFIFKGEEYVQMSKDYYIKEKLELVKQLEKLKNTVAGIKKLLKDT